MTLEDRIRLAVSWVAPSNPDRRIVCVACLGLRRRGDPPCQCRRNAMSLESR